jgi:hypothetical protein
MGNETFFNNEWGNSSDAVMFCAARAFFNTATQQHHSQLISYDLAIGKKRRAPCGTRRTHPASNRSNFLMQLEIMSAVASRNHFPRFVIFLFAKPK